MNILFDYTLNRTRLPIISITMENQKKNFIIDSGSNCSLIDSNLVEYFKDIVKTIGEYNINGIDGTNQKVEVIVLPFIIEGKMYEQRFCVKPLLDAFKDIEIECGIQVHGLLGTDFLLKNKCIIDFKNMEVKL